MKRCILNLNGQTFMKRSQEKTTTGIKYHLIFKLTILLTKLHIME